MNEEAGRRRKGKRKREREGGKEGGRGPDQKAYLEAIHVEEDVRIVPGIHRDKGILPIDGGEGAT
jgi:hypothetical protein